MASLSRFATNCISATMSRYRLESRNAEGRGKVRVLSIRDRVVQGALKLILEPMADFQPASFGYRPSATSSCITAHTASSIIATKSDLRLTHAVASVVSTPRVRSSPIVTLPRYPATSPRPCRLAEPPAQRHGSGNDQASEIDCHRRTGGLKDTCSASPDAPYVRKRRARANCSLPSAPWSICTPSAFRQSRSKNRFPNTPREASGRPGKDRNSPHRPG